MNNNRLGCLSPTAIIASIFTLVVTAVFYFSSGSALFTAGGLSARGGEMLGGVSSHAQIGNDCASCHPAPWSSVIQADLCIACHENIAQELAQPDSVHSTMIKDVVIACRDCHPDHRGADAPLTVMESGNFPHEGTGYSLRSHQQRGDGKEFVCADCHVEDISSFDQVVCTTCHAQVDKAFTDLHTQVYGADCLACHDGKETIGKNYDHSLAIFKLDGGHIGLACQDCHANARGLADFQSAPVECFACHEKDDEHDGEMGMDCALCHTPESWENVTFDHDLSSFKLVGEHREAKCDECHSNGVYKGTPTTCYSCHEKDDEHEGKFGQDCALCHSAEGWEPATFDHDLSAFKLEGKHADVECDACHINGVYKGTASTCFSCHQKDDSHNGKYGQDCAACHLVSGWKPSTFNHNLFAFKLNGAHTNLACENCHANFVFKGAPTACAGCHADPAFHRGMFSGSACSQCHSTSSWRPATYKGPHPGIADEGGRGVNHGGKGCTSCHTVNLSTATCTQCHDGNNPDGDGGGDGGGDGDGDDD